MKSENPAAAFEAGYTLVADLPPASPATKGQCNDERACVACWSGQGPCEVAK